MSKNKYHQGIFKPQNPKKYSGDLNNIVFRSSWELRAMRWMDNNPSILKWNSEGCVIPYLCPTDLEMHRYFVDFAILTAKRDGSYQTSLIEIKPAKQRIEPKYNGKNSKRFIEESMTYIKNQAKWAAAEKYCQERKWNFVILDEYDLGLKIRPING